MIDINNLVKQYDNKVRDMLWNRALQSGEDFFRVSPETRIVNALKLAQQGANTARSNISGYKRMLRDTAPKVEQRAKGVIPYNAVDDLMYALQYGDRTPKVGSMAVKVSNKPINNLYPTKVTPSQATKQIQNAVGTAKKSIPIAKSIAKYAPVTGDVYDLYAGTRDILKGHPVLGGTELAMGAAGLATLGTGSIAKSLLKAGVKRADVRAIKGVLDKVAANRIYADLSMLPVSWFVTADNKKKEAEQQSNKQAKQQIENIMPDKIVDVKQLQSTHNQPITGGSSDSVTDMIKEYNRKTYGIGNKGVSSNNNIPQSPTDKQEVVQQVSQQLPEGQQGQNNIDKLVALHMMQQQQANAPYLEALANYINNYNQLSGDTERKRRYYAALSGLSGNEAYAGVPSGLEPTTTEANRINLMKALADAKMGNTQAINEMYGNMVAAQQAGLDPMVGLASKPTMQMYAALDKSNKALQGKQYTADMNMQIAQYRGQIAQALQNQKLSVEERLKLRQLDNALAIQQLKSNTLLQLGTMGAFSRPYSMGMGLSPEYGALYGVNIPKTIVPQSSLDPAVMQQLLNR